MIIFLILIWLFCVYEYMHHISGGNDKKTVIILKERYSFHFNKYIFPSYFMKILKKKWNVILLSWPEEMIPNIEKTNDLHAVLMMQDCINDSYLYNMTINDAFDYYKNLESRGVIVYPNLHLHYIISSKIYNLHFEKDFPEFALPGTKILHFPNFDPKNNDFIKRTQREIESFHKQGFEKIVIKKGFSYEAFSVITIDLEANKDYSEEIEKLESVYNWGANWIITDFEKGIDRILIMQPFNPIITIRTNEFRCFFVEGKFVNNFAFGTTRGEQIIRHPNLCYDEKNEDHVQIVKLAHKVYDSYVCKYVANISTKFKYQSNYKPPIVRVDISYSMESEKKYFYVNEIEIQPTYFFDKKIQCGDKMLSNNKFNYDVANALSRIL